MNTLKQLRDRLADAITAIDLLIEALGSTNFPLLADPEPEPTYTLMDKPSPLLSDIPDLSKGPNLSDLKSLLPAGNTRIGRDFIPALLLSLPSLNALIPGEFTMQGFRAKLHYHFNLKLTSAQTSILIDCLGKRKILIRTNPITSRKALYTWR